eukprot:CAMPEP_0197597854 /NCGR_PEP_ID=MMETSP1326-20131121/28156_1 /TAXON_ID=1155430 /ORGANISM="Genus nov. species nov., Strain RCC2288" /LENGTH=35 /DNA_ID= /DNA_START= /DNA_END= /DNA_ORIENTATION=
MARDRGVGRWKGEGQKRHTLQQSIAAVAQEAAARI